MRGITFGGILSVTHSPVGRGQRVGVHKSSEHAIGSFAVVSHRACKVAPALVSEYLEAVGCAFALHLSRCFTVKSTLMTAMNVSKLFLSPKQVRLSFAMLAAGMIAGLSCAHADIVQMVNGDRHTGMVVAVVGTNVTFQSQIQGLIELPRDKVAAIYFRPVEAAATNAGQPAPAASGEWLKQFRNSAASSNLVEQVRQQLLAGAGPEANQRFDELVQGLMGGTIRMDDIRKQAQESVNQLRSLKGDLGEDGEMLEGYLRILEGFLDKTERAQETVPPGSPKP